MEAPKGDATRPTSDRVREAIFSMLDARGLLVADDAVLDLYAGSGILGLEALSRHAGRALFVDHSPRALRAIRSNVERLGADGRTSTVRAKLPGGLRAISTTDESFDLVFADPPYDDDVFIELSQALIDRKLVRAHAVLVFESRARASKRLAQPPSRWSQLVERTYGDTSVAMYELKPAD